MISVVVPTIGGLDTWRDASPRSPPRSWRRERFEVDRRRRLAAAPRSSGRPGPRARAARGAAEPNGPSGARNAGADAARGEFVAFTDDDCEPSPGWLPALERALAANPGRGRRRDRQRRPRRRPAAASQAVVDAVYSQFNRDPAAPRFFASSNVAFPLLEFRAFGGFDERFRYAEDREMCERWLRTGHRFAHAPEALVVHMRTMTLREFWRQHYGYGRGASAFARRLGDAGGGGDRRGVIREIGVAARRGNTSLAAHLALSQVATLAGYSRETVVGRRSRG